MLLFNPSKSRSKRPYVAFSPIVLTTNKRAYIDTELQLELELELELELQLELQF